MRVLAATFLGSLLLLSSSDRPTFTTRDKAFFADPSLVDFVRPGLVIKITSASLGPDGTIRANFTASDPKGLPLDVKGATTPGPISTSFVAAYIPKGQSDYIALTTRTQTSPITKQSAVQPAADSGGSVQATGNGQYTYTFKTKAPSGFDLSQTVTIGVYATRDLSEFDLGSNYSNSELNFAPNNGAVANVHDVVATQSCNKCHDPLAAHGGSRRDVALCVLCHNPGGGGTQTIDPDTGNSIDMKVMVHKIHMGSGLPSVQAGTPYQIIGFQQGVNDYSDVTFPADARNCQMCHETGAPPQGGTAPPGSMNTLNPAPVQGAWWITHPSRAACGACHDNVNFASGENHVNLPQTDDSQCARCHIPQGTESFDASILGAHTIPQFAPEVPGVVFGLMKVDNGLAGKAPTVTFTLKDKAGNALNASDMNFLNLVMAGPASDYAGIVSEDVRKAGGAAGTFTYTFQHTVPATATGTYTIGIEGYRNVTLAPGTEKQQVVRDVGHNQLIDFSVDGSPLKPHAIETTNANCNACHYSISAHGTIRNETAYCLLCHNPTATDQGQRPASAGAAQSIDFPVLIHRIHRGSDGIDPASSQLTPYIVWGFGGRPNDFSDVGFPGDLRDCAKCHVNGSQELPLPAGRMAVVNPRAFFTPMGPVTSACTACHVDLASVSHALSQTSTLGESCAVCHGPQGTAAVDKVHATSQ